MMIILVIAYRPLLGDSTGLSWYQDWIVWWDVWDDRG